MKKIPLLLSVVILTVTAYADGKKVQYPLGFHTVSFSAGFWSELKEEQKLKGKVSEIIAFEDIENIFIIRCYMHVTGGEHVEKTIQESISSQCEFSSGPIPERLLRNLHAPLLTALFQTKKGAVGLLTIYHGMTILEFSSRYGMILGKKAVE